MARRAYSLAEEFFCIKNEQDGGRMKTVFPTLKANWGIKNTLGRDIAAHVSSHAYIIEGAAGSGKKTAARLAAAALSCEKMNDESAPLPCGSCLSCRKILGGFSPDIVTVSREDKASIGVEQVRSIKEGLYVAPNDSDMRVYIIEEADKMTAQAQNALLLTLEEPPSFVTFFLLAEDSTKLLETIRSRAQTVRTELLCTDDAAAYLRSLPEGAGLERRDSNKFKKIISASGGSAGKMKTLLIEGNSSELIQTRESAERLVSMLLERDAASLLELSASMPKGSEQLKKILVLAAEAVRDIIVLKKSPGTPLLFYTSPNEAGAYPDRVPMHRLMRLHDLISDTIKKIEYNVSQHTLLTELSLEACVTA